MDSHEGTPSDSPSTSDSATSPGQPSPTSSGLDHSSSAPGPAPSNSHATITITYKEIYRRIFRSIFYRIWLHRKLHYLITFLQLVMPSVILYLFVMLHSSFFANKQLIGDFTGYESFSEKDLFDSICEPECGSAQTLISYVTPPGYPPEFLDALENSSFAPWYTNSEFKFLRLQDEQEMLQLAVLHHIQNLHYVAGIVFKNDAKDITSAFRGQNSTNLASKNMAVKHTPISIDISFEIRMVKYIPSELSSFGSFAVDDSNVNDYKPFMGLQLAVTRAFLHYALNGTLNDTFQLNVQPFPSPPHVKYFLTTSNHTYQFVTISLVLGFLFVVFSLIKAPCTEQETLFKPYLHLTGFPRWAYWLCWILNDSVIQLVAVGLQVTLLFVSFDSNFGSLVKHGSPVIWTMFLLLYSVSAISFLTFLASFFSRGVLGTYVGATIWLLSFYFADLFLPSYVLAIRWYTKLAMCVVPNAALIWGITIMAANPGGISFSNMFHRLDEDGISLFQIMIVLGVDIPLYFILTFMLDRTHHGIIQKPWYALMKLLFQKHVRHSKEFGDDARPRKHHHRHHKIQSSPPTSQHTEINVASSGSDIQLSPDHSPEFFDLPFPEEDTIIETSWLTKAYYNKAVGVYKVNMKVEANKCTTIVGHHGSGKSTLVNLLCGEESPTSGSIKVCGYDSHKHKRKVQALISVCTSKNVLCNDMTVLQHLLFLGMLKGLTHHQASAQAMEFLQKLRLTKKKHKHPEELFDFEKRKLCISMAFMGNSKIVIIDEPTKKIADEEFCKSIWDFILSFKGKKTIIVSTFSMNEGYFLGDRVVILSNGRVVATGTSKHLEHMFGTGYQLKLKLKPNANQEKIRDLIQYHASTSTESEPLIAQVLRSLSAHTNDASESQSVASTVGASSKKDKEGDDKTSDSTSIYYDAQSTTSAQRIIETVEELRKIPIAPVGTVSTASSRTVFSRISDMNCDMEVLLPKSEVGNFPNIFAFLENQNVLADLGIEKWRLFLYEIDRAYKDTNEYVGFNSRDAREMLSETQAALKDNLLELQEKERLKGFCCGAHRLKALIIKRCRWLLNMKMHFLVQMITPIILLVLTIQGTNSLFHNHLEKSMHPIGLENFPSQSVLISNISDSFNFTKLYENTARQAAEGVNVTYAHDFRSYIKNQADPISTLSGELIAGVQVEDNKLTAMFSPLAFHAGPVSFQLLLNTYLKFVFPQDEIKLKAISHPIQNNTKEVLKFYVSYDALVDGDDEILSFAVILGFGFFVLCSGFTVQPVAERVWKIKQLQLNTSTNQFSYWFAFFLSDWPFTVMVAGFLLLVLQNVPNHAAFADFQFAKYFVGVYILSSLSSTLLSYNASFLFRNANTCFYGMLSINQVFGLFLFTWAITIQFGFPTTGIIRLVLEVFLQPYCVPAAFYSLIQLAIKNNKCELLSAIVKNAICNDTFTKLHNLPIDKTKTTFDLSCCPCASPPCDPAASPDKPYLILESLDSDSRFAIVCICLLCHSLMLSLLLVHMQTGAIGNFIKRKLHQRSIRQYSANSGRASPHSTSTKSGEKFQEKKSQHGSIQREKNSVSKFLEMKDALDRQNHLIIDKQSITTLRGREVLGEVQLVCVPGQITAIYGPPGAGKTVLMSMLAKIRQCRLGSVNLNESELLFGSHYEIAAGLKQIGYCPENVTKTFSKLTAIQLLRVMGRLRGIPEMKLKFHVKKWTRLFGFTRANEPFRYYSESMKRKVFIMLALIGDQQVLLFDNPTKNLDPASKFQFWLVINHLAVKEERTIVISTSRAEDLDHSRLSGSKIAVLVNGNLQYVMTPEAMMNQMGRGYTIMIMLKPTSTAGFDTYAKLKVRLLKDLTGSILQEERKELLRYSIPRRKLIPWSALFSNLETIKREYEAVIESYSARETLLEDILHVASLKQKPTKRSLNTLDEFCIQFC